MQQPQHPRPASHAGDGVAPLGGPAAAAAWEQVLDRAALDRLRELDPGGRAGLLARVLSSYAQSLTRLLDEFGAARRSGDVQALRHIAHTLKSSSASVGALQMSAQCADIERRVRDGQQDGLEPLLDDMAAEGARMLRALLSLDSTAR
jgi:HPt (histidine-containing phosphotransfer) domain-containing protein